MDGLVVAETKDDRQRVYWNPVSDAYHVALQGQTRSGKSVAAYTLLSQLLHRLGDVVALVGADNSSLLFHHLPGDPTLRWESGDAPEACGQVLADLVAMMDARLLRLLADRVDKFDVFSPQFPLLFVVLEELPGLMNRLATVDKKLAAEVRASISRLLAEGAKVGIRVLAIAQRFDASLLGGDVRSNFAVRLTLRVDNYDALAMLSPDFPRDDFAVWRSSLRPGDGILEHPLLPGPTPVRCGYTAYETFLKYAGKWRPPIVEPPQRSGND